MSGHFVDRRTLMAELLVLVGAASVPSRALAELASAPVRAGAKPVFLSNSDFALLREMGEGMIPKTDTPGAADAGVAEFIDGLMINWAGEGARAQLRRAISEYRSLGGSNQSSAARMKALVELDQRSFVAPAEDVGADSYRWLKRLVFLAYRTSEAAFTNWVPNPGTYRGNLSRAEHDAIIAQLSVGAA